MENLLDWGVNVVLWFQKFSPTFDLFFKCLTFLGNEEFFLLFLPIIYWCVDRRAGARLLFLFLFSAYINSAAKVLANQPRPFNYDLRVKKIVPAGGGGFPSGHTQSAVVLWGYLAYHFRKKRIWILAGILIIGTPLSRIYLGVHFPTDIFGGYVIGVLLLFLFIKVEPLVKKWLSQRGLIWQLGMAVCVPTILIGISPEGDPSCLIAGSTLMGFATGMVLERRWVRFSAVGIWWKRVLRYLLGIAVLFGLWIGLRLGFHNLEPISLFRVIRYTLVGLWSGLGSPWIFTRLNLAETEQRSGELR